MVLGKLREYSEGVPFDSKSYVLESGDGPAVGLSPDTLAQWDVLEKDFTSKQPDKRFDKRMNAERQKLYTDPAAQAEFFQRLGENGLMGAE